MSVVILTKHSTTGTPTNLSNGELAVDITSGKLWVGNLSAPNGRVQVSSGVNIGDGDAEGQLLRWNNTAAEWETTEEITIDSTGKVGLGTTNPLRQLHIKGSVPAVRLTDDASIFHEMLSADTGLILRVDHGNTAASSYFRVDIDGTEKCRIDEDGNFGLGTASPQARLDVRGLAHANQFRATAGSAGAPSFSFDDDTDTGMYKRNSGDSDSIGFSVGGQTKLYLTTNAVRTTNSDIVDGFVPGTGSTSNTNTIHSMFTCTQQQYDALTTKKNNTLYVIV